MRDVMDDLETLGTRPGDLYFSLGAVAFDRDTGEVAIDDGFYRLINIPSAIRLGMTTEPGTIAWWSKQSPEAQVEYWKAMGGGESLSEVMCAFGEWLQGTAYRAGYQRDRLRLWSNGADFDNVLMQSGCRQINLKTPWNTFGHRCFRTLKTENPGHEPVREGIHHHALHDAIHQARWACAIYKAQRDRIEALISPLRELAHAAKHEPMSARARGLLAPRVEQALDALHREMGIIA